MLGQNCRSGVTCPPPAGGSRASTRQRRASSKREPSKLKIMVAKEYVYVIRSKVKSYTYVGITNNVERRIKEHNSGYNRSTRPYFPFELLFTKEYPDKKSAREYEKFLKSGKGREFIAKLKQAGVA